MNYIYVVKFHIILYCNVEQQNAKQFDILHGKTETGNCPSL